MTWYEDVVQLKQMGSRWDGAPCSLVLGWVAARRLRMRAREDFTAVPRVELMRLYLNTQSGRTKLENVRSMALSEHRPPDRSARRLQMNRLDPAAIAKLVDGYQAGECANELATHFGIHRHTVAEVLKRNKVERHPRGLTQAQVAQAGRLYGDGWSLAKVGNELSVTANTVRRYLLLEGMALRSPQERHHERSNR